MQQLVIPLAHANCALQSEARDDINADGFHVLLDKLPKNVAGRVSEANFDLAIFSAACAVANSPVTDAI